MLVRSRPHPVQAPVHAVQAAVQAVQAASQPNLMQSDVSMSESHAVCARVILMCKGWLNSTEDGQQNSRQCSKGAEATLLASSPQRWSRTTRKLFNRMRHLDQQQCGTG